MTDILTPSTLAYLKTTLSNLASIYRYRLRYKWQRLRRALLYARGRLSQDDAQDLLLDCCTPAGWHPLLILSVEDTLEEALEEYEDHPALRSIISQACMHVAQKWEDNSDTLYHAKKWALEFAEQYAKQDGIPLTLRWPNED